ncbi:MAG: hypothetical protein AXA67_04220 [Methylothermaceae bacteria B42]|nr:MAG: hypothetical protein AXA67_04220 [Methylothermaceae bacteria B42]HHJ38650.1 YdcF family protein [Methylothermaceae bacterium]
MSLSLLVKAILTHVLERLTLPPGGPIVLLMLGLILWRWKAISTVTWIAMALLYLSTIPATTRMLWALMAIPPPLDPDTIEAQAIVILGATRYSRAPEYGGRDTMSGLGLERLRYGAWLQKKTGFPILVSGRGFRAPGERSEAQIMQGILEEEFGAKVAWREENSVNTYENARYSARILKNNGIQHILLVTHAYHMPRAKEAFQATGLEVTPAATVYFCTYPEEFAIFNWLPENRALYRNRLLLHEMVGRWWYRMRYYSAQT